MAAPIELTRTHRVLIGVVVFGAVIIAGIGFAGSYAAVRELAVKKGFGNFSYVFPIGIDAGICVLLALDLLLTWIRIPFPLLRQTAWLLTAATIAFNGAAAWPDPLGVGMHSVIPILFVVSVEAARHAVGRIADITADKHMEGVRLTRWLLSPVPTFLLWRRMKLWELRSYDQVIKLEQERLVYQARLRSRFGRAWRRKAPVESLMPLRLARYGVPLAETAPAGLAAAGIEPALLPPVPQPELRPTQPPALAAATPTDARGTSAAAAGTDAAAGTPTAAPGTSAAGTNTAADPSAAGTYAAAAADPSAAGTGLAAGPLAAAAGTPAAAGMSGAAAGTPAVATDPSAAGMGPAAGPFSATGTPNAAAGTPAADAGTPAAAGNRAAGAAPVPQKAAPHSEQRAYPGGHQNPGQPGNPAEPDVNQWLHSRHPQQIEYHGGYNPDFDPGIQWDEEQYRQEPPPEEPSPEETGSFPIPVSRGRTRELGDGGGPPEPDEDAYYQVFRQSIDGSYPTPRVLGDNIQTTYGTILSPSDLKTLTERFQMRHSAELEEDHIA
ncbi:DUF2637 domain-containing protein [Streptomyces sp. NPDC002328]|uniref:DUF2637 domain-containing protein n=1 Tax=Streptomyces sp. NPDC002328 TaxID=3364642 RepID=UPI00367DB3BF